MQFFSTTKPWVELTEWTKTLAHIRSAFATRSGGGLFFHFLYLAVKNAFQLYRSKPLNQGQKRLDLLGFRKEIVQIYHARFRVEKTLPVIFPKNTQRVNLDIRYDGIDHWIAKGNQRRCAKCSKMRKYFCERCDFGLHPDCFKDFHIK